MLSLAPRSIVPTLKIPAFAPPKLDPFLGRVLIDRYELQALAGSGSYGNVYRAKDRTNGVDVAVKVLLPHLVENPEANSIFDNEQRFSCIVCHPRVVARVDAARDLGTRFLVFPYHDPHTLQDFLDSHSLMPHSFIRGVGIQLMDLLIACHEADVGHMDVKPANLLLDRGTLRLIDFGIARLLSEPMKIQLSTIGTRAYMAPERLNCTTPIDHRSDIYSVGVILYELLTGTLPRSKFSLGAVPITSRYPHLHVHPDLEQVVLTSLASDPNKRFQSMKEMLDVFLACRCWPSEQTYAPVPLSKLDKRLLAGVGVMVVGTFIAAITAGVLMSKPSPKLHTSDSIAASE